MEAEELERIGMLRTWIEECPPKGMVFFGGAGVSTESGIPDFRSQDGLYAQKYDFPPETIISRTFFDRYPDEFYRFYVDRMIFLDAQPNAAHRALAKLEQQGKLSAVVTQNIDGLHQAAGSKEVYELHGSTLRNYCMKCGRFYDVHQLQEAYDASDDGIPRCSCGGIMKPDVVLYEESLDNDLLMKSLEAIQRAHLMVIAGTSLVVNPAASLVSFFGGEHLVIVNRTPTPRDEQADLCITTDVGKVFDMVVGGA